MDNCIVTNIEDGCVWQPLLDMCTIFKEFSLFFMERRFALLIKYFNELLIFLRENLQALIKKFLFCFHFDLEITFIKKTIIFYEKSFITFYLLSYIFH
jgi:hypothetical protein